MVEEAKPDWTKIVAYLREGGEGGAPPTDLRDRLLRLATEGSENAQKLSAQDIQLICRAILFFVEDDA